MRPLLLAVGAVVLSSFAAVELLFLVPVAGHIYLLGLGLLFLGLIEPSNPLGRFKRFMIGVAAVVIAAVLYFAPWSTRKPFLRDLRSIHAGMTEAQVRQIMSGHIEGTGWPASPFNNDAEGELILPSALVFRHADSGSFNSDWAIIHFVDGKVDEVEFSAD